MRKHFNFYITFLISSYIHSFIFGNYKIPRTYKPYLSENKEIEISKSPLDEAISSFLSEPNFISKYKSNASTDPQKQPDDILKELLLELKKNNYTKQEKAHILLSYSNSEPTDKSEKWGTKNINSFSIFKTVIQSSFTPSMLMTKLQKTSFSMLLDGMWNSTSITTSSKQQQQTEAQEQARNSLVSYVNVAFFYNNQAPILILFTLKRVVCNNAYHDLVWLIDDATFSQYDTPRLEN